MQQHKTSKENDKRKINRKWKNQREPAKWPERDREGQRERKCERKRRIGRGRGTGEGERGVRNEIELETEGRERVAIDRRLCQEVGKKRKRKVVLKT